MTRNHCDRCDAVIEGYKTWVEIDTVEPLAVAKLILHLTIVPTGGNFRHEFCRHCWQTLLAQHVGELNI